MRTLKMKSWILDEKTRRPHRSVMWLSAASNQTFFFFFFPLVPLCCSLFCLLSLSQLFPTLQDSAGIASILQEVYRNAPSFPAWLIIAPSSAPMAPVHICHCTGPVVLQWSACLSPQLVHWEQWLLYSSLCLQHHARPHGEWLFTPCEFDF